jgi:hypothetical protein
MRKAMNQHVIERTSPKGSPFLGVCILCGEADLKAQDAANICPNPQGLSRDEALQVTINGPINDGTTHDSRDRQIRKSFVNSNLVWGE